MISSLSLIARLIAYRHICTVPLSVLVLSHVTPRWLGKGRELERQVVNTATLFSSSYASFGLLDQPSYCFGAHG